METMTIGKIAKAVGVGVETVRFYERRGLIEEPQRRASGYREYPESAVARLHFIRKAKELGFSLKEIEELLSLRMDPGATCAEVKERAEQKVAEVEAKIRDLQRIKRTLGKISATCKGSGPVGECPIIEALE